MAMEARYSTDSASLASIPSPLHSAQLCAVRADSPLLGFHLSSTDPLHYPSPDYARELSLEHEYPDACDKQQSNPYEHARGLDPVHELEFDHDHNEHEDYHRDDQDSDLDPIPRPFQFRSRSHSAASSTYLAFAPPSSRRASRLPSFSSTLDSPQPLPPAVIPALRERVSSRSLQKQTSALSLRRTTTDSTPSLLSSHPVSLAGIGTPDSVRNAVYIDSDHLDSLLLAVPASPTTSSPSHAPFTHSPRLSSSHIYSGRPSSTGSQVYLGPVSSTPTSPRRRAFPSRSSDESSGACLETEPETPGTSPASATFDCVNASPAHSRLSWADDTELAHTVPHVYIHADADPVDEYEDDAEFGFDHDHDGEHTYTYGQRPSGGLAPPQCSRWSLGSSIDAAVVALEKKQKKEKEKHRDSWGNAKARKRDSGEKMHRKSGSGEKKMGRRKRLVSFISSRFSAAPASASVPVLTLASVPAQGKQVPKLDVEKDLPSPLFDKELPPIKRSSPSPPLPTPPTQQEPQTRPTLALTIPATTTFTASFSSPTTTQTTPTTATSTSALDLGLFTPSSDDGYYSRSTSPFVAAPGPEDDGPVVTVTAPAPATTERVEVNAETEVQSGLLSPTSIKTFVPPAPSPVPTTGSPVFTPPPPPMSPPPVAYGEYTYSYVDPPSPGLDPFRAASPAVGSVPEKGQMLLLQPAKDETRSEAQSQVQKKRSRRSLGIRGLAVRMGLASSSPSSPTSTSPPPSFLMDNYPPSPPPVHMPEEDAYPTPSSPTKPRRKGPKRKLVISGIEEGGYDAVREWCEGFGEVKEIRRVWPGGVVASNSEGKGSLVVDFRKASVADTVCRLQAQVYIRGAGSVSLSWCTKTKSKSRMGRKSGV